MGHPLFSKNSLRAIFRHYVLPVNSSGRSLLLRICIAEIIPRAFISMHEYAFEVMRLFSKL